MNKVGFASQKSEELKRYYVKELEKIQKRASDIGGILAKLGVNPIVVQKTLTIKDKKEAQTTIVADNKAIFDWVTYLKETFDKQQRVMTATELTQFAVKHFEIPVTERRKTRNKLSSVLSRIEKGGKRLRSVQIEGVLGRSFGLTKWFDDQGQLIRMYNDGTNTRL